MEGHLLAVHPSIVEGKVEPPEICDGPIYEGLRIFGLAHIGHLEDGTAAGLPDDPHHFFAELGVAVTDHERDTSPSNRQRGGPSNARPAAAYHHHFVLQVRHDHSVTDAT